ncbi:MAG: hypothetical protein AAFO78_03730 [Pseudomonadota bacterium]
MNTIPPAPEPVPQQATRPEPAIAKPGLLVRLFGYKPGTLVQTEQFVHWVGTALLFMAIVTALTLLGFAQMRGAVALFVFAPFFLITLAGALVWFFIRRRMVSRHHVLRFQRAVYVLTFPAALYVGLAGGVLLNVYTDKFLALILFWQGTVGFTLVSLTGRNALQYGMRVTLALLPTVLLLLQTGEPRLTALAILVYLSLCLATLVQLDMSDTSRRHRKMVLESAKARDRSAAHLSRYLSATRDFIWSIDAGGRRARLPAALFDETQIGVGAHGGGMGLHAFETQRLLARLSQSSRMALRKAFFAGIAFSDLQIKITHKDGQTRWYSLSGAPDHDRNGLFAGFSGMAIDISAAIHARQKINIYTERLEDRVAARTQALTTALAEEETARAAQAHRTRAEQAFFAALLDRLTEDTASGKNSAADTIGPALLDLGRGVLALTAAKKPPMRAAPPQALRRETPGDQLFYIDDMIRTALLADRARCLADGVTLKIDRLCGEQVFANPDIWSLALRLVVHSLVNTSAITAPPTATRVLNLGLALARTDEGVVITIAPRFDRDHGPVTPAKKQASPLQSAAIQPGTSDITDVIRTLTHGLTSSTLSPEMGNMALLLATALLDGQGGQLRGVSPGVIDLVIPRVRLMARLIA